MEQEVELTTTIITPNQHDMMISEEEQNETQTTNIITTTSASDDNHHQQQTILETSTTTTTESTTQSTSSYLQLNFSSSNQNQGKIILKSRNSEFGFSNNNKNNNEIPIYTKGIKWSPDGLCLLSNSNDNIVRLFELPQELLNVSSGSEMDDSNQNDRNVNNNWSPCLSVREGGCIHDFCWHPLMSSLNSLYCNFLTVASKQPVHMWDAFNGSLLNSFLVKDKMGEIDNIVSISFNGKLSRGNRIYCGLNERICVFDAEAGSSSNYSTVHCMEKQTIRTSGGRGNSKKSKTKRFGQTGLISCFDFNPVEESIYVAGCYNNTIGIYDQNLDSCQHVVECEYGNGVNFVKFSSDGNCLLVSSRKSDKISCWDLRNLFEPVKLFDCQQSRGDSPHFNNQKVNFDTDAFSQYACSGTCDGKIKVFDLVHNVGQKVVELNINQQEEKENKEKQIVNGVNFHPYLPYIAFCTGERKYKRIVGGKSDMKDDSDDSSEEELLDVEENYVGVWQVPNFSYFTC